MRLYHKILKICVLSFTLIIFSTFYAAGQTTRLIVIDPLVENEIRNIKAYLSGAESDHFAR